MRKTVEPASGPCRCAGNAAKSRRAEIASAPVGATRRGNVTISASGENFAMVRTLLAAKVSRPFRGRSVQLPHWCSEGCVTSMAVSCGSSQHGATSSQVFSIATLPSPQRQSTMPSTPADADATKTTRANRIAVQAFTRKSLLEVF